MEDLKKVVDKMDEEVQEAPVVVEEIGSIEAQSVEVLKKSAYYAVFSNKEHEADMIGASIQNVHVARFESKADLKKVVSALDTNGFKLIDILKGRPLTFKVIKRVVTETEVGN